MSENVKFRVSSGLKDILGRDLITSDNIAILELVKNSYDAHAQKVIITIQEDMLTIADNGKGMSKDDIINKWLFVAYSAKRDGTEDKSYRSKFTRNYAGAKGIGRMSCDRLAQNLTLKTKIEDSAVTEQLIVDWSLFEKNQQSDFDEVELPYSTLTENPEFPDNANSGTILQFTNLRTQWTKGAILKLRRSLEKMINPFAEQTDFQIEIVAPQYQEEDKAILQEINSLELFDKTEKQLEEQARQRLNLINGPIENRIKTILSIKTTQIESHIVGNTITTTLTDRGTLMYKIQETNKFSHLQNASMILYYLNRAAKHNFTLNMGVNVVNYGNLFLFRNNFRIYPYGEFDDDSWGFNQRAQQGRARYLGTRSLLGRVDIQTNNVEDFKEVSSRDGGLVKTEASEQLFNYVSYIHKQLERYVVGVLWGVNFIQNQYFISDKIGLEERKRTQIEENQSENIEHIYDSVGSRLDFVQLIKGLANNPTIQVLDYNKDLANIIENQKQLESLKVSFVDELRKMATQTNDTDLLDRINKFEQELETLKQEKEEAEKRQKEEEQKRKEAEKQASEAEKKRKEEERKRIAEEQKRKKAETELAHTKKQNIFLQATSNLDVDRMLNFHHDIRIQSRTIENSLGSIVKMINKGELDIEKLNQKIELVSRANARIISISQFATKANFNSTADYVDGDVIAYIHQYVTEVLPTVYRNIRFECITNTCSHQMEFRPLEVSLIIDNLLSNAQKKSAKHFTIEFIKNIDGNGGQMFVIDDGKGLDKQIINPQCIFEKGFTTTNGSGLGLHNVAQWVREQFSGTISVDESFLAQNNQGFKLIITF